MYRIMISPQKSPVQILVDKTKTKHRTNFPNYYAIRTSKPLNRLILSQPVCSIRLRTEHLSVCGIYITGSLVLSCDSGPGFGHNSSQQYVRFQRVFASRRPLVVCGHIFHPSLTTFKHFVDGG